MRFEREDGAGEISYTFSGDVEANTLSTVSFGGVTLAGAEASWSYHGIGIAAEGNIPSTPIFGKLGYQWWKATTEYSGPLGASSTTESSGGGFVAGLGVGGEDFRVGYERIFTSDVPINYFYLAFDF